MLSLRRRILKNLSVVECFVLLLLLSGEGLAGERKIFNKKPRHGDRFFVAAVFKRIFGPEAQQIVHANIIKKQRIFGGGCSPYDVIGVRDPASKERKSLTPDMECFIGLSDSKIAPFIDGGVIRSGFITKTCEQLIGKKSTREYAYRSLGLDPRKGISANELQNMYSSFYSGRYLNEGQVAAMLTNQRKLPKRKQVKLLLLSICSSEQWQIL